MTGVRTVLVCLVCKRKDMLSTGVCTWFRCSRQYTAGSREQGADGIMQTANSKLGQATAESEAAAATTSAAAAAVAAAAAAATAAAAAAAAAVAAAATAAVAAAAAAAA